MLLTQLHETITRRAKSVDELQKLIDVSGSTGIEAVSADTVKITDRVVTLQNIVTPGQLPFKFEPCSEDVILQIAIPTLRTLHGLEGLEVQDFVIGRVLQKNHRSGNQEIVHSKLTTLKGMPKTAGKVSLSNMPELKSLEGLNAVEGFSLSIYECQQLTSLAEATGVKKLQLMGCNKLSFQGFPQSCEHLDMEYLTLTRCLPWFITIPKTCKLKMSTHPHGQPFCGLTLPEDLVKKLLDYQEQGKNSNTNLLEIQTALIDADLDDLAEL